MLNAGIHLILCSAFSIDFVESITFDTCLNMNGDK